MSRRVEILYTGIVGLVPEPATNSFKVVVQNASQVHHGEKPHLAWIAVETINMPVPKELGKVLDQDKKNGYVAYGLSGWDAEFDNHVTSGSLHTTNYFRRFILRLADGCHPAYPGRDRIDGRCRSVVDPATIAARFPIRLGELDAGHVEVGLLWQWDLPGAARQHVTQEAIHRFEIAEDELVLSLTNDEEDFEVVLRSKTPTDPIRLIVGNTLKDDIFPNQPPKPEDDVHVRLYYDLAAMTYPSGARPALKRREAQRELKNPPQGPPKKRRGFRRTHGSNCPPGLWSS